MLRGKQIVVIVGGVVLIAILYWMPRSISEKTTKAENTTVSAPHQEDIKPFIDGQIATLNKVRQAELKAFQQRLNNKNTAQAITDSLAGILDNAKLPAVAAYYYELLALTKGTEKNYLGAAYRYFDGYKATDDSLLRIALLNKAIVNYKKVLELNPANLDAKTDLGVCYTETAQPMQGIMLLREVVTTNPSHENAQMNLGILSVRSRQFDKAADRFNKVLAINPAHTEVYLYLGECYAETGQNDKALEAFTNYKNKGNNAELKKQAQHYIEQLNHIKSSKK